MNKLLKTPRLALAVKAAHTAGRVIKKGYGQMVEIRQKSFGDLFSAVDIEAESVVVALIKQEDPWSEIIAEESAPELNGSPSRWILDCLDGSVGFLFMVGKDKPAVLIAHQQDGVTDVGVIYLPLTDELFFAVKGMGAFTGNGKKLQVDASLVLRDSWVEMNQYGDSSLESDIFARLRVVLRRAGGAKLVTSQAPHSSIAMRMLDGTMRLAAVIHDNNPKKVKQECWDVAAVKLIVEEAGGVVVDFLCNEYDIMNARPFIVASSVALAYEIIDVYKEGTIYKV
ncbi:MAG: inositol monophosphatase [Minisyncoccia bacterium]